MSLLSWLVSVLGGGAGWVVSMSSPLQSDVDWQEHLTFSMLLNAKWSLIIAIIGYNSFVISYAC